MPTCNTGVEQFLEEVVMALDMCSLSARFINMSATDYRKVNRRRSSSHVAKNGLHATRMSKLAANGLTLQMQKC